jgi:general secretion pathway protein D
MGEQAGKDTRTVQFAAASGHAAFAAENTPCLVARTKVRDVLTRCDCPKVAVALIVALVCAAFPAKIVAQEQPRSAAISLPDSFKLSRLVDLTAEATGQSYTYNPADLEPSVTLRVNTPVSPAQLQELTTQVLASRGMAVVRGPDSPVLTIVKLEQAASASGLSRTPGAGYVTEVIEVKHTSAKAVADAIKPLLTKTTGVASQLGDSSLIVVSDFAGRLREIEALVAKIDAADSVVTDEVALKHVAAAQVAALVIQLAAKRELAGGHKLVGDVVASPDGGSVLIIAPPDALQNWKDLIAQADRREGIESVTYTPRFFAPKDVSKLVDAIAVAPGSVPDERFKIVIDDLTGSLIVSGTTSQHERIAALMSRLDTNQQGPTPFRSFPIRNRPVNDMLATLRQLIAAGVLETDSGTTARAEVTAGASQSTTRPALLLPQPGSAPGPTPTGTSAPSPAITPPAPSPRPATAGSPARPPLSLTADESTNTLIAIGEPRLLSQLENLLAKLDVRQPQVMLEVMLISLSDADTLALGMELERLGSLGNATVQLSSLFGLSTGPAAVRSVADAVGFTGAVLNQGEYSVIVRALQTINKGRSLSNPKLLVTNNEKAVFSSTVQQPVQSTTRTGSNDTTFSYGGTENAGTTISVKPQIAQGDHLVLTYSIKLSSFVGTSATPGLPPPKQENAVDSVATIPDGHTVVVGGLDLLNDSKAESRVPLIADIPGIGELFKNRNNAASHTRFFVFIRATVLRSGSFEDLKYISEVDTHRMGVDDGFPEVLPRIIR